MPYSTWTEVQEVLKGLIEPNEYDVTPGNELSQAQIEREISNADAEIDLALRKAGYSTPLSSPPALVHQLSIDIAVALCDLTFRGSRAYEGDLSPFRIRYDRAKEILELIAEKDYPVYNPGDPDAPVRGSGYDAVVINPYPGPVLLDKEVFPRGIDFFGERSEYAETEHIPYNPYLSEG
jgi:phage gp36-like protein